LPADSDAPSPELLVTGALLKRAQEGDPRALEALMARYRPRLERWASGRLPHYARSLFDTADLVQETLLKALEGLDLIEVRGPGFFQAYVRQAVLNRIRDQVRWARRRPGPEGVPEHLEDRTPSPLETAIGMDVLERYDRALEELTEEERQLLHLRIELDYSYEEIAIITERNTRDAARMAVQRALHRLAEIMDYER
jgi:RNA polymerase sigma-70 factor (ECF subfamily)